MSLETLWDRLGTFISGRSTLVLAIALFLILPSFIGAGLIEMKTGMETMVSKESRAYQDYEAYNRNFVDTESIVVFITTNSALDFDVLSAMSRLGDTLSRIEGVTQVTSLASIIKGAVKERTGQAYIPHNEAEIRQVVNGLPQGLRQGLMPDEQHAIMSVEMPATLAFENGEALLNQTEGIVDWVDFPADVDIVVTGNIAFWTQMEKEMNSGLRTMLLSAAVLMVLILWLVFRHVRKRLLPLAVVIIGVIWTFGAMGFLGVPLTTVSMAVFPLLIGVGIDYAIQLHNRMDEEVKKGGSTKVAVVESLKNIAPPVAIAVITSCLGYMALFTSPVPMIRDFGMMNIIGLVLCYLAAVIFSTPLLYKLYHRAERKGGKIKAEERKGNQKREGKGGPERVLGMISTRAAKYPIAVILVAVLLTAVGYIYDQRVGVSLEEEDFVPQDMPALVQMKMWQHLIPQTSPLNLLVSADDVTRPEVVDWLDEFGQYEVELRSEVKGTSSLASLIKGRNGGEIPDTSSEISLILSEIPESQKKGYIKGKSSASLRLDIDLTDPDEGKPFIEQIERDLNWRQPPVGVDAGVTGQTVLFSSIWDAMTTGRLRTTFLGALFIFLGLLVIYRDWLRALIPIIPLTLVTGLAGGSMYLLDLDYNPLTATLGAMTIGLGVEYSILIMGRYFEERGKGQSPLEAVETATSRIGIAILSSGLTTMGGFGAMIISGFPILRNFGVITVLIFVLVMLVTFTVLPALIVPLDRWRSRRKGELNMGQGDYSVSRRIS